MRFRLLVPVSIFFIVASSLNPAAASAPAALPFSLTAEGQVLVPVMVNDAGPYQFILDTGANRSVVSDALADRLALPPVATTDVVTSSGAAAAPVVRLQSIALGFHEAPDVLAAVLPAARIRTVSGKADGIIGQDVLIDAHYTLDYRRKKVIWHTDGIDAGSGIRLSARRVEGRLLVELPQSSRAGEAAVVVPDSGASILVLYRHEGKTAIAATRLALVNAGTMSSETTMQAAVVQRLQIGSSTFWDQPALVTAATGAAREQRLDGLLPLMMFASVTFNGRTNCVTVRP